MPTETPQPEKPKKPPVQQQSEPTPTDPVDSGEPVTDKV